ncbi:MAG: antigen-like protein [Fibrobacteres bacterium]|nr:antigen-like protein [Fibrobacterota bacterium]
MRIACLIGLTAVTLSQALVGDWTSFTHLQVIRDLEASKGELFIATTGGIRKLDVKGAEKVYRNTEGLRDVGISALAAGPQGEVYATSELGYVYRYDSGADDWEILGTSYRGAGWKMNKRALLYRAGYLVLGSEKGLSFFNLKKKVAEANVTKMGKVSGMSVNSVLFVGDTLFAGTSRGIFKTVLHLDRLLTDPQANIFNPGIWTNVGGTDGAYFFDPEANRDDSAYKEDSLKDIQTILENKPAHIDDAAFYSHGSLYYGDSGIASDYEGSSWPAGNARVSAYGKLILDGKVVTDSPRLEAIINLDGKWYLGNLYGLYHYYPESGSFQNIDNREDIPKDGIIAVKATRSGVYLWAAPRVYKLIGKEWKPVGDFEVMSDATDSKIRGQHAFDVPGADQLYLGTWGQGFHTYVNGEHKTYDAGNSCIVSTVDANPNYPVIWSQTLYKNKGIWMTNWVVGKGYHFGYYDLDKGTMQCFAPDAKDDEPRNLQVVGDSVLTVVTERGVEAYRFHDNGGSMTVEPANLLAGLPSAGDSPLAAKMDRLGNLWVTTKGSNLFYIPSVTFNAGTAQSFKSLDGFTGTACLNLESDPQGHLWAGCTEGGVFEIIPGRDSLSHTFRKYGLNEGLLSDVIFHLDVNQDNGDVWVATEKGLARLESTSRPTRPDLSEVKVYPNPFLAKHANVVFSNLSPGSQVQVTTQSGSVVYHQSLTGGTGDQIRWNGRNQAGERVREGVYFYIVRSPKETKNGKIIVAR